MAQEDPKDLREPRDSADDHASAFLSLPAWSSYTKMPPLPDQLKPLGRKPLIVSTRSPSPASATPSPAVAAAVAPAPQHPHVSDSNPTLIAVSPFLEWIKDHPTQAAAQAHKEADAYRANPAPATTANASPYWMPPIDETPETTVAQPTTTTGSSAAIYSTPQRD